MIVLVNIKYCLGNLYFIIESDRKRKKYNIDM